MIHHKGHEGTQRLEKIRENLCKSVQSVAESCPSEQVNEVSTEFQNTLLDLYNLFDYNIPCEPKQILSVPSWLKTCLPSKSPTSKKYSKPSAKPRE